MALAAASEDIRPPRREPWMSRAQSRSIFTHALPGYVRNPYRFPMFIAFASREYAPIHFVEPVFRSPPQSFQLVRVERETRVWRVTALPNIFRHIGDKLDTAAADFVCQKFRHLADRRARGGIPSSASFPPPAPSGRAMPPGVHATGAAVQIAGIFLGARAGRARSGSHNTGRRHNLPVRCLMRIRPSSRPM